jgi:hypothetical protein
MNKNLRATTLLSAAVLYAASGVSYAGTSATHGSFGKGDFGAAAATSGGGKTSTTAVGGSVTSATVSGAGSKSAVAGGFDAAHASSP